MDNEYKDRITLISEGKISINPPLIINDYKDRITLIAEGKISTVAPNKEEIITPYKQSIFPISDNIIFISLFFIIAIATIMSRTKIILRNN